MTTFGPQLIGETEKTLNALLHRFLAGANLTEPHWVSLRLAAQLDGQVSTAGDLATAVRERAHFEHAADLVADLSALGYLADDRLTGAGREFLDGTRARIEQLTAPIWAGLAEEDVAATERVLNAVAERARAVLAVT